MKSVLWLVVVLSVGTSVGVAAGPRGSERQIQQAVLAAPEEARETCTVLGYGPDGKVSTLRQGSNNYVCLADHPDKPGFSVACYDKGLEPYMARGRQLRDEGKNEKEVWDTRDAEVKSGALKIPENSILFVLTGREDPDTGEITDRYLRYVIYIPFATSESTGIPTTPAGPGAPWIMDPGTHHAHIMSNPPRG